ncbi:MAG: hypothetical protein HC939_23515 [Pleurocapsa sp. SU_5_0]|nr:hypothetical protein [Pleurocapsa sp. SU_5_0]
MVKRFSRLKYALETLRTPNSTAAAPDAPAGTVARKFQDYKGGKVKLTYTRSADSKPGQIQKVSILPFYFGGAENSEAIVAQSARAILNSDLSAVRTQCNQKVANFETDAKLSRFIPAKATVFDYGTATTSETSQITGIRYDKKTGNSYTYPFGASATEKTPGEVRKGILAAVTALGTASVSFSDERYRGA